jgi:Aspartyl/Asparaginyl beta-hydroxylase
MQRYITDIENLKTSDLQNIDWDIIELPFSVDHTGLLEWYQQVKLNLQSAKFVVSKEYEKYYDSNMVRRWQAADPSFDSGNPTYWWLLNWSKERYDPLPFSFIANKELYPEIGDPNFSDQSNPILSKYKFGAFEKLYNKAAQYLLNMRVTVIPEGSGLHLHVDVPYPNVIARMHMNLQIHENCVWYFGHTAEREYILQPGKVYLVNTAVFHSVINHEGDDWVILYGTPKKEDLESLFKFKPTDV